MANEIPLPSQSLGKVDEKRGNSAVHARIQGGSPPPKYAKAAEGSLIELQLSRVVVPEASARGQAIAPSQLAKEKDSAASKAAREAQLAANEPQTSTGKSAARKRDTKMQRK